MSTSPLEFGKISNFGQLTSRQLGLRQSRAKIIMTFDISFYFCDYPPPPYSMLKKN